MSEGFAQYNLTTDTGATVTVDTNGDQVVVQQSSQGTNGRGAAQLSAHEAHELARQLELAAAAAMSFRPPEPAAVAALSQAPHVQQLVDQLGPEGIAALVREAVRTMTPEQLAAARPDITVLTPATPTAGEAPAGG